MNTLFVLFLSALLAGTVLPLMAIIANRLMRKTSASARHRMLTLTVVGLLVFPFTVLTREAKRDESNVAAVTQSTTVTQQEFSHETIDVEPNATMIDIDINFNPVTDTVTASNVTNTTATANAASFDVVDTSKNVVVYLWLVGVGILLVHYLSVHIRMILFIRRKTSRENAAFGAMVDEIRQRFHLRRPIHCELTEAVSMPVTVGIFRSRILFPIEAKDWSDGKIHAVLLHELAHIVRCDIVWQNVIQLASIAYWFQPLVWFIVKRIKIEQEFACDDMVLESGQRNSDYASVLLDLSKSISVNFSNKPTPEGGLTMLRKKTVIKRIDAILDTKTVRRPIGRKMTLTILAATLCLVGIVSTFSPKITLPAFAQTVPPATNDPNAPVAALPSSDENNPAVEKPVLIQDKQQDEKLNLLQKRVEAAKIKYDEAAVDQKHGTGSVEDMLKQQIALADAEIALYNFTDDQTKLIEAVKVRFDAANNFVITKKSLYESGRVRYSELVDAEVVLADSERMLAGAKKQPTELEQPVKKTLLFQGKTFEQWVSELQTELDPKMRIEAFRALAAFGANGRGKEATNVIFDIAKNYDFQYIDSSVFGELKNSAIDAFSNNNVRIPVKDSIPIILQRFSDGDNNEKLIAINIFRKFKSVSIFGIKGVEEFMPKIFEVLTQWDVKWDMKNANDRLNCDHHGRLFSAVTQIWGSEEYVLQFLKDVIAKNDVNRFDWMFTHFSFNGIEELRKELSSGVISVGGIFRQRMVETPFGLYPVVMANNYSDTGRGGRVAVKLRLTPFGESLLKLLQESGVNSSDERIRETSKKVVEALLAVEKIQNEKEERNP